VASKRFAVHVGLCVALSELRHAAAFVASRTRREQRQVHPVAAVERQLLDLSRIDIGRDRRPLDVDQRRLAGDRDRFLHSRRRQLHVDGRALPDQDLEGAIDRAKAAQLGFDGVGADAHR
jgi:hypothetical protein